MSLVEEQTDTGQKHAAYRFSQCTSAAGSLAKTLSFLHSEAAIASTEGKLGGSGGLPWHFGENENIQHIELIQMLTSDSTSTLPILQRLALDKLPQMLASSYSSAPLSLLLASLHKCRYMTL